MNGQRKSITIRDFLEALEKIHKFVTFGERVSNVIQALARAGIDVSSLNPMDFNSLIRFAGSLRSKGYDIDEIDIVTLKEEFEEILDMNINEINEATNIVYKFSNTFRRATQCAKTASRQLPASPEAVNNLFALFGLQPKIRTKATEKVEEEMEEEEKKELSDELVSEFKEIAEKYRKMKESKT